MARRQEVLLTKDVLKLGNMGDIVRVAPGYARNHLFPYELAIPAIGAAKRQIEVLRAQAAKSEVEREGKANLLKKTVAGMSIQLPARVAHDDVLFGSIGTKEIVAALAKSGVEIDGKQIHLRDKLKKLGKYTIEVRLHKNVGCDITVEIINSDPNAPALSEALAATARQPADDEAEPAEDGKADEAKADGKPEKGGKKSKQGDVKIKNLGSGKGEDKKAKADADEPTVKAERGTSAKGERETSAKAEGKEGKEGKEGRKGKPADADAAHEGKKHGKAKKN